MRGLYAIVDADALGRRGLDVIAFTEAVLDAGPAALQLRDKHGGARRTLELLRAMAPLARRAGVPLFANDRPDLAVLARCEGVHVGQEDLPVPLAREIAPGLRVGLSTHDAAQVRAALLDAPDYLAIGPVFPTSSKERPSPVVGLARLAELAAEVRAARPGTPIVAIGGIGIDEAAAVGRACGCAAVIAALLPPASVASVASALDDVRARARALHQAIAEGP